MVNSMFVRSLFVAVLAQFALVAPVAVQAQTKGSGKIVCWKDKSGKVVGCGDSVPPEYQSSATKELDQRGVTRKTTESAEDAAKRRAQEKELADKKAAEEKRLADQRRQDSTLLSIYSNEQEIDAKRDRELKAVETQIAETQAALKNAEARLNEAKSRKSDADAARASSEIEKLQKTIAAKEKEREELRQTYAAQKKRYQALKGPSQSATAPAPAAPAPAKK
jgi:hypothetical protein